MDECQAVYRVWDLGDRLVSRLIDEIPRQRMTILDRMETFLEARTELSATRRQAINDARHQMAREKWMTDPKAALQIVGRIARSDQAFRPSAGPASPPAYRLAYGLLGFRGAQALAGLRRLVKAPDAEQVA
jgi:hypothetical protein